MSNRLGIYADKIEAVREQRGLTPAGFRTDGTDALKSDKEAMLRALYEQADARLHLFGVSSKPAGIGGPAPNDDDGVEENQPEADNN